MLGLGCTAVKYVLWIVNFLIFLVGMLVLGVGVWVKVNPSSFLFTLEKLPIDNYQLEAWTQSQVLKEGVYAIIGVGGFLVILGFLGCCGASRENRCFLLMYGIIVLLVALLIAVATGVVFGFRKELLKAAKEAMDDTLLKEYQYSNSVNDTNIATNVLNLLMTELHCCGVGNYRDFQDKVNNWPPSIVVPAACCQLQDKKATIKPVDPNCQTNPTTSNSYIGSGCFDKITTLVKENLIIVLGGIVGLIVLLLINSIFSFMLFHAINRHAAVKPS